VELVVFWPDCFDLWKLCRLLVVSEGVFLSEELASRLIIVVGMSLHQHLIGVPALL